ncbi:olfactory receptor 14A16-like [Callospermophilus lateralis]|uniref:olfactory receptor 14A16-like n=1 Tax=Callospermophilus lateralis TaxID=76772 RepID=UPI004038ECE4
MASTANHTVEMEFYLTLFSKDQEPQLAHGFLFLLIYLVALVGNLLIIILVTVDQCLHTPMYFFLKNLSFLDACLVSVTVPNFINDCLRMSNNSMVTEFLLLGFSDSRSPLLLPAVIFTAIYLAALVGNGLVITITSLDPGLHSPMYLFLRNLSLFDICLISAVVPKAVANWVTHCHSISFLGFVAHVFLVLFSADTGLCLLTAMSMDRYAAICHPLHYEAIMSRDTCVQMATLSWLSSGFLSAIHTRVTAEIVFIIINVFLDTGCFAGIIISYVFIFSTFRRIPSTAGRGKAYSTCLPHLAVVVLFLSTGFCAYLKPLLGFSSSTDLSLSVGYVVLPRSLNPIIYNLRNKAELEKLVTGKLLTNQHVLLFLQE